MKRRRWIIGIVTLLAVAAGAFFFLRPSGPDLTRTAVEPVQQGNFVREVSGTGVVEAARERTLSFATPGTVDEILVAEGDQVEEGTVLAQLDTSALERDLASSRANLQSAQAELQRVTAQEEVDRLDTQSGVASARDAAATAEQTLAEARRALSTAQQLFERGAASQNELTEAQDAVSTAQRQLEQTTLALQSAQTRQASFSQLAAAGRSSGEAQVAQLQTTIANQEQVLEDAVLRAPFAGTVATIGFDVGDEVGGAAAPTGEGGLRLVDTSSLLVTTNFDENRASELQPGQPATITPDADADARLDATVRRVGSVADRTNNTAQLEVKLDFEGDIAESVAAGTVRPGYTVTARVTVNSLDDALLVPLEAVSEEDGESYVYKVTETETEDDTGEGTVERAPLTVLDRNATLAAAESEALAEGELIAVINLEELSEGGGVAYDAPEPLREQTAQAVGATANEETGGSGGASGGGER